LIRHLLRAGSLYLPGSEPQCFASSKPAPKQPALILGSGRLVIFPVFIKQADSLFAFASLHRFVSVYSP
jgi:hypothetical protein